MSRGLAFILIASAAAGLWSILLSRASRSVHPVVGAGVVESSAVVLVLLTLVVTLMLRTVGANDKGKAIGLRGTANRVTSMVGPFLLGALAGVIGLEWGFYIIGILSSLIMLWIGLLMIRHPEIPEYTG